MEAENVKEIKNEKEEKKTVEVEKKKEERKTDLKLAGTLKAKKSSKSSLNTPKSKMEKNEQVVIQAIETLIVIQSKVNNLIQSLSESLEKSEPDSSANPPESNNGVSVIDKNQVLIQSENASEAELMEDQSSEDDIKLVLEEDSDEPSDPKMTPEKNQNTLSKPHEDLVDENSTGILSNCEVVPEEIRINYDEKQQCMNNPKPRVAHYKDEELTFNVDTSDYGSSAIKPSELEILFDTKLGPGPLKTLVNVNPEPKNRDRKRKASVLFDNGDDDENSSGILRNCEVVPEEIRIIYDEKQQWMNNPKPRVTHYKEDELTFNVDTSGYGFSPIKPSELEMLFDTKSVPAPLKTLVNVNPEPKNRDRKRKANVPFDNRDDDENSSDNYTGILSNREVIPEEIRVNYDKKQWMNNPKQRVTHYKEDELTVKLDIPEYGFCQMRPIKLEMLFNTLPKKHVKKSKQK